MKIANRPLNTQAIALEEAETKIRILIKNETFKQTAKATIDRMVNTVISSALESVSNRDLRSAALRSLKEFARRQYAETIKLNGLVIAALLSLINKETSTAKQTLIDNGFNIANLYGSPLKRFAQDYIRKEVKPTLDRLSEQLPLDPGDITGRNSLRNRAEMEVRYQDHIDQISGFRAHGIKLVIASTHADCSPRCSKLQGRVYSLDGTYGVTDDGRRYVPIEVATDIFYTTRAGKTYKNGLLGFNCRHYLVEYQLGLKFPKPNITEERKQDAITRQQRALERNVRRWRTKAVEYKDIDRDSYQKARIKAIEWNKRYIQYSQQNKRAYYPSRVRLI